MTDRARMKQRAPAVVLVSGGLDSTTTLAIAQSQGYDLYALTFQYGQRHEVELDCAHQVAGRFEVKQHVITEIDLRLFGGSALTDDIEVPKNRENEEMGEGIPITYVPARNTIFLSFALAWAEVLPAHDIFLGVNAVDYSGYPDCRPDFVDAFERLANLATREGVEGRPIRVHAPLMKMGKAEIIETGSQLGVEYGQTRSCYDPRPDGAACGRCDACSLRLAAFAQLGMDDPAPYADF